ncbi:MAG: cell division protein FtsZ [Spirosomataceae bacterium]|jgi:cell division protein FtsZ
MGGGTGTGAAPEIARIAKELGLLVVAVVSDPFGFEGNTKILQALEGIEKLKEHADTVLVIKNQLLQDLYKDLPVRAAYKKADEVLANGVKSIAELITSQGEINCDFADVKMVLQNAGQAMMGSAVATGDKRAIEAITQALESPLLENNKIFGAKRILVSIAYSDEKPEYEIKMSDQTLITEFVQGEIQADAEVFKHGYSIDRSLKDGGLRVTIVAAGFGSEGNKNLRIQPKEEPAVIEVEEVKVEVHRPVAADYTRQMVEYFVNNDYKGQPLNEPSFKRWTLDYKLNTLDNSKTVEKFPLAEMYEGLRRAGLIK